MTVGKIPDESSEEMTYNWMQLFNQPWAQATNDHMWWCSEFVSQFSKFSIKRNDEECRELNRNVCAFEQRNSFHSAWSIEIEIAWRESWCCSSLSFSSFPYGLVNRHKFQACIIPAQFPLNLWEFARFSRIFGLAKTLDDVCDAFRSFVACSSSSFRDCDESHHQWSVELPSSELRLGFDLFLHSSHDLIKRVFETATERTVTQQKKVSVYGWRWKDERKSFVLKQILRSNVTPFMHLTTSVEALSQLFQPKESQKTFNLWPAVKFDLLCSEESRVIK